MSSTSNNNNGNFLFSSSWMKMEKPNIVMREEEQDYGATVSYYNLFSSYAVESPMEQTSTTTATEADASTAIVSSEDESGTSRTYSMETMESTMSFTNIATDMNDTTPRRHERNGAFTFKENGEYNLK